MESLVLTLFIFLHDVVPEVRGGGRRRGLLPLLPCLRLGLLLLLLLLLLLHHRTLQHLLHSFKPLILASQGLWQEMDFYDDI